MPGGAARVDLLGSRIAPFLARWLHHTIHEKLLKLPETVEVYPTHGGGSFCSAAPAGGANIPSSIKEEKDHNPFAAQIEEGDFVQFALGSLGSYPRYFPRMADINRRGPDVLGGVPRLASLTALSVRNQMEEGVHLVDTRPEKEFNIGHVSDAFAIPFGNSFATWVGWIVPWAEPLVLLSSEANQHDSIVRQLIRIGYDRINGFLAGGLDAWRSAGLPAISTSQLDLEALNNLRNRPQAPLIIDVRQRNEFLSGHISGALNIELGELQDHLDGLPREIPVVTVCAAGMRATTAASILRRDGRDQVQVVDEKGTPAWIELGYPYETGGE